MSRDWNIVDDSEEPAEPEPPLNDTRLDGERIRRIVRERRAADRSRQWRIGLIVAALLGASIIGVRVASWLLH